MALLNRLFASIKPAALVAGLVVCALYSHFYVFKSYIEIDMETDSALRTMLRVYWADQESTYTQGESAEKRVGTGRHRYAAFLGNLSSTAKLRIDPIEYTGKVVLRGIRISQPGYAPIELTSSAMATRLQPVQQITDIEQFSDGLVFNTTGGDAQFELTITPQKSESWLIRWVSIMALIMLFSIVLDRCLRRFGRNHGWVVICLTVALVLIVVMSVLSRFNTHPDEYVHWQAVKYYTQNFLAPPIDSPDIADSYSIYGFSRLANFEVFYQLAGYSTALLQDLRIPLYLKARLFNCLLFLALVIFAARNRDFRIVAIPLLLSAQAWYLFGYINSDAFGLFIAMLVSYQAVSRQSMLNRTLSEPDPPYKILSMIAVGLLAGLLLVSKTNYYFFALLVVLYFFWRMAGGDFADRRRFWLRGAVIALIALVPYGARLAMDMHANGFDSSERAALRLAMNEKYAEPQFKPSTPVADTHIYLKMREKGASIKRMLHRELWHTKTRVTAFGVFGYTQIFTSSAFYAALASLGTILSAVVLVSILLRGPPSSHILFSMTAAVALSLVVSLFWYSWTISFQPQGRYLAAILPMLSILLFEVRRYIIPRIFEAVVIAMFLMGLYVFLFVGVAQIEKISSASNVFV